MMLEMQKDYLTLFFDYIAGILKHIVEKKKKQSRHSRRQGRDVTLKKKITFVLCVILLIAIVINLWSRFHKENPKEENVISSATILHKLDEKAQMIESGIVSTQINQMVIGQDKVSYLDDSRFSNDTQYTTFRSGDEENKVEFI